MASETAVWTYERRLELAVTREQAWRLFTDPVQTRAWLLPFEDEPDGVQRTTIEGQPPVELRVLEIEPPTRLKTAMSGGNMPGRAETTTTITDHAAGTLVDLRHEGFGDPGRWAVFGYSFGAGWDEAICDLQVFVRTGVVSPRHIEDKRASIAAWPIGRPWGVELAEVFPGGFCDRAGMAAGDMLLTLDRMGIYDVRDIWGFTRARAAGESVSATFIRGRVLLEGRAALSRFEDFGE